MSIENAANVTGAGAGQKGSNGKEEKNSAGGADTAWLKSAISTIQNLDSSTDDIIKVLGDKLKKGKLSATQEQMIANAFADRSRTANFATNMFKTLHEIAEAIIRNMRV